jgi:hypothetical protein
LILKGKEDAAKGTLNLQTTDLNCIYDIMTGTLFNSLLALSPCDPSLEDDRPILLS